ncbi:MAG: RNA polymerase factor sigma-54 [Candidatus Margulisiibacteriota bacterium]|jgi:RNA polymerase sigma-54 factor
MLRLIQRQELKTGLKLRYLLAPKIIQMLKLFSHSYQDLCENIIKESKDNVFLEIVREDSLLTRLEKKTSFINEHTDQRFWENVSLEKVRSLREFLISQLRLVNLRDQEEAIALFLIDQIDERGYLNNYQEAKEELKKKYPVDDRKIKSILTLIQSFEPDGVGARNLRECLLIQVNEYDFEITALRNILQLVIKNHLDDLGQNNYEKIANELNIKPEGLAELHTFIKNNLNPNPGSGFGTANNNNFIVPSFEIEVKNGQVIITNLEREQGLKVSLSPEYLKMLEDKNLDKKTKDYLVIRLEKAQELVDNLNKRYDNLEKIFNLLVQKQESFFIKGHYYLEPLLQKDLASELAISSSTLSRIISAKYIQTAHGVLLLKSLCPRSHFGKTKARFLELITQKFQENPGCSDQKISELLAKENFYLARRTVAKYRKLANIEVKFKRGLYKPNNKNIKIVNSNK